MSDHFRVCYGNMEQPWTDAHDALENAKSAAKRKPGVPVTVYECRVLAVVTQPENPEPHVYFPATAARAGQAQQFQNVPRD